MYVSLALTFLLAGPAPVVPSLAVQDSAPPSRALLHELCRQPRLAGTLTAKRGTDMVARVLKEAGWQVTLDEREVLLSLPRRLSVQGYAEKGAKSPIVSRIWNFDPDAVPAGDIPPFNAWTASGLVQGPLLDVGYGMRGDYERLIEAQIPVKGTIAIARYGKGYRGVKLALAEEFGCVGLLLFSDPKDDGAEKARTWPKGPWKPGWAVQRGSVGSLAGTPGDPSTPGFASPIPGRGVVEGKARLTDFALAQALPKIPCMPIGASDATALISNLARRRMTDEKGAVSSFAIGPGPTVAEIEIDAPRELRTIVNVIGKLEGKAGTAVMAGNHRDAWVRGAQDAGSGTVGLLRAAQILGEKKERGWSPKNTIYLGFWDAEEFGLIGSTEWVEANKGPLSQALHLYINADALVSGQRLRASGTPGLEGFLAETVDAIELPEGYSGRLPSWRNKEGNPMALALPGSGSDYAPFLHHIGIPVLDLTFVGNSGGQYHTSFDDVPVVESFLDPGYQGHELAANTIAALLEAASERGRDVLDEVAAAESMARHALRSKKWMGAKQGQSIANAFRELATTISLVVEGRVTGARLPPPFYRSLLREEGIPGRPWYRHVLWSTELESGYGSETYPILRAYANKELQPQLDFETKRLVQEIQALQNAWELVPLKPGAKSPKETLESNR